MILLLQLLPSVVIHKRRYFLKNECTFNKNLQFFSTTDQMSDGFLELTWTNT